MASRKANRAAITEWLGRLTRITESDWVALCSAFPETSAATLRKAVRLCGLPLSPLVEGVRQESFEELRRTLRALQAEFESAADHDRRQAVRARVIEAKTHAQFAARRAKNPLMREEMIEWMLVWLNDPKLFDAWSTLAFKKRSISQSRPGQVSEPDAE